MQALSQKVDTLQATSVDSQELVRSHGAAIGVLQQGLATLKEDVHQDREVHGPPICAWPPFHVVLLSKNKILPAPFKAAIVELAAAANTQARRQSSLHFYRHLPRNVRNAERAMVWGKGTTMHMSLCLSRVLQGPEVR